MKIVVFGKTGQVARELMRLVPLVKHDLIFLSRRDADFTNDNQCIAALDAHSPDAVINAVAYTAVDRAEDEPQLAHQINAETVSVIAQHCAKKGIRMVHISTDYVFDGSGDEPHAPNNQKAPLNVYGASKLAGEDAIRAARGSFAILRTSWVFSVHGSNFVKTMLRLSESRSSLSIVDDQIGGPTPASEIAHACLTLAEGTENGTYHFSGTPNVSWAEFAREIFAQAGQKTIVSGIPTADYPTPARRPLNSRLDCASLQSDFGITRPSWKAALSPIIKELI